MTQKPATGDPEARAFYFEVSADYRKSWGRNMVSQDGKTETQLRLCPFDNGFIEKDERGVPVCKTCGHVFPIPNKVLRKALGIEKERPRFHNLRERQKFINMCKYRGADSQL